MSSTSAAVLYGIEDVRVEERPIPQPQANEVTVAIRSVGICGSDTHYYRHGRIGDFVVEAPLILGHESSGVITAAGSLVNQGRIGERVALEPGVPCGLCALCRRGRYNLCADVRFFATPPIDGTLIGYVTINERFAYALPESLSYDVGALIEPLSVAIWANRKAETTLSSVVLVSGAGPVGILAAQVAKAAGAAHVSIVDINPDRLSQAASLGADLTIDAREETDLGEMGATVLLECSGEAEVTRRAIRALRPAGRAVLVGMAAASDVELPVAAIQSRELTVTGIFRYANTYPEAITLAASSRLRLDELVGWRLPLDRTVEALEAPATRPGILKTIVTVSED